MIKIAKSGIRFPIWLFSTFKAVTVTGPIPRFKLIEINKESLFFQVCLRELGEDAEKLKP
jgi:hypothetical protein